MNTKQSIFAVLIALLTVVGGALIAQQGSMQMPPGMQMPMPTPMNR